MASRKASTTGQGNGLAAAGRERAHLELAELGPLLEEKGDQGAAGSASVSPPPPPAAGTAVLGPSARSVQINGRIGPLSQQQLDGCSPAGGVSQGPRV